MSYNYGYDAELPYNFGGAVDIAAKFGSPRRMYTGENPISKATPEHQSKNKDQGSNGGFDLLSFFSSFRFNN